MPLALALLFPLSESGGQLVLQESDLLVETGHLDSIAVISVFAFLFKKKKPK